MNQKAWRIATEADLLPALEFFETVKDMTDPPFTTYPHGLRGTLELLLAEGKLLVAEPDGAGRIVGLLGYFHGTPRLRPDGGFDYEESETAYVYCFVVGTEWRNPWSFLVLPFLSRCLLEDGHEQARFRTYRDNNDLINRLYRKYGYFIREETNLQGTKANLYGADVRMWAERFGYLGATGA